MTEEHDVPHRRSRASAAAVTVLALVLGAAGCATGGSDGESRSPGRATAPVGSGETQLPSPERATLRLGMSTAGVSNVPGMTTHALALYEKYGLEVELVAFDGAQETIQALQAGQIDVADVSGGPVVASLATPEPMVMVMVIQSAFTQVLASQPEIRDADGLRGQAIAVSGPGALSHAAVLAALESLGLSESDVTITPTGGTSERLAALEAGSVGAGAFALGLRDRLVESGFNILIDLSQQPDVEYPGGGIVVPVGFAEQNPNTVLAIVAANLEGLQLVFEQPDLAARAYADFAEIDVTDAAAEIEVEFAAWERRDGRATQEMFERAHSVIAAVDPGLADLDPTQAYTLRFLDQLAELGITEQIGVPED